MKERTSNGLARVGRGLGYLLRGNVECNQSRVLSWQQLGINSREGWGVQTHLNDFRGRQECLRDGVGK